MHDIYRPPSADVTKPGENISGDIFVFDRFSTWYALGLSIITLNLYAVFWLYTRTKKLNTIVPLKISKVFYQTTAILFCFSYAVDLILVLVEITNPYLTMASTAFNFFVNILYLVWVYKFRNRLKDNFSNENVHIGIVAPFFFLHLFLQYKLNELVETNQRIKRRQSDTANPQS